jgi:hypothetical protein
MDRRDGRKNGASSLIRENRLSRRYVSPIIKERAYNRFLIPESRNTGCSWANEGGSIEPREVRAYQVFFSQKILRQTFLQVFKLKDG